MASTEAVSEMTLSSTMTRTRHTAKITCLDFQPTPHNRLNDCGKLSCSQRAPKETSYTTPSSWTRESQVKQRAYYYSKHPNIPKFKKKKT